MDAAVTVREVMDREYVGVSESDDLVDTAELLLAEDAGTAVVLRGSEPVGVLTCRDVLALLVDGRDPTEAVVGDAMTAMVPTVSPDMRLEEAADILSARDARRLVVTEGNGTEPLGILTEHDLLATRSFGRTAETSRAGETVQVPESGVGGPAIAGGAEPESAEGFEDQSICEGCGTLTSDLAAFNGQLLCADCRDM